ncbi:MAG TPA: MMPL family transporter [Pirellulaceae bacterium]|nr:MMPL family transporter [Pirellulaceae bacterium]
MSGGTERIIGWLVRWRQFLLVLGVLLAIAAWFPARQMKFDRSIENMFAADDPLLAPYRRLKAQFGGNEVVLAVYRDEELLAADGRGIRRLSEVSRRVKKVPGVKDALSLAEVNGLLESLAKLRRIGSVLGFGAKEEWKGPAILNPRDELAAAYRELFAGYTHSRDGQTVAVAVMLEPHGDAANASVETSRRDTIEKLQGIVEALPDGLAPGVLAGEPVMVTEGFKLLEDDGRRLGWWSTILLGLVILVSFRNLRWLVVPIALVQWAILTTQAALVVAQLKLSMVSSMLTAIVTVVGVATVIHLIVHYRELSAAGAAPIDAFRRAAVLLAWPIAGAIVTDCAGFGSLWFASVGPVQDFGLMMVAGSLMVLVGVTLLVPGLTLAGAGATQPHKPTWAEGQLDVGLSRLVEGVQRQPWLTGVTSLLVCALAAAGSARLEVETDFTRNFRTGSRIVAWYEYVETRLGGAGVWDVLIPAPGPLDEAYLDRVRRLETKLREVRIPAHAGEPSLTKVISLVDALDAGREDRTLGAIPTEIRVLGMTNEMPAFMGALQGRDESGRRWLRIMLRARERQPAEQKRELIDTVTRLAREEFPAGADQPGAEVTGFFVLLTRLIESMLRDQWTTFGIATGAIFVMLWIGFRRLSWALIGLIPNALPIFAVMGVMGWIGLKINMGAAMIAAVSMGLSVDSSIHYFAAFRRQRAAGRSVRESLDTVQKSVGRAMIVSTLALIVGFAVLCNSEFVPTIYFGALVSLAMLGGMAGNLIVLPLLLSLTEENRT